MARLGMRVVEFAALAGRGRRQLWGRVAARPGTNSSETNGAVSNAGPTPTNDWLERGRPCSAFPALSPVPLYLPPFHSELASLRGNNTC